MGTSIPTDANNVVVASQNPNVVRCTNNICTAISTGTAQVTVSFPVSTQTNAYGPARIVTRRVGSLFNRRTETYTIQPEYEIEGSAQ